MCDDTIIYRHIRTPQTKYTNARCINQTLIKVTHTQKENAKH